MKKTTPNSASLSFMKERRYSGVAMLVWGIATLYAGYCVAHHLFLIYVYGYSRVQEGHLYFVSMRKGGAWIVSNGDHVTEGHFLHFMISLVLWIALFSLSFPLICRLLPKERKSAES